MPSCVRRVSLLGDDRQEAVNLCARIIQDLHLLRCLAVQPHGFKERGRAHLSPRSSLLHYLPAASVQIESSSIEWDTMVMSSANLKKCQWVLQVKLFESFRFISHTHQLKGPQKTAKRWNVVGQTFQICCCQFSQKLGIDALFWCEGQL